VALWRERFGFLFDLTTNEQEFLDSVLDRGENNPDLLDVAGNTCAHWRHTDARLEMAAC
jgi:hypothetical protein